MTSLQEALAAKLGVPAPVEEEQVQFFTGVIPVRIGRQDVLIFDVWASDVPPDFQVMPVSGGSKTPNPKVIRHERDRRNWAQVDPESFVAVCSVASIQIVLLSERLCRVYLNYEVDEKNPGFNYWNEYEEFIKRLFATSYEVFQVYWTPEKTKACFTGNRSMRHPSETTVFFERIT